MSGTQTVHPTPEETDRLRERARYLIQWMWAHHLPAVVGMLEVLYETEQEVQRLDMLGWSVEDDV